MPHECYASQIYIFSPNDREAICDTLALLDWLASVGAHRKRVRVELLSLPSVREREDCARLREEPMELTRYCPWCKRDMILSHDHLCCWYQTHVLTMDNVTRQCEIEKLEYWWALHTKEESC